MELYLIRHTTPNIPKNTIYGWSDVACLQESFLIEAEIIKAKLPSNFKQVYSSNSLRCKQLATYLFPNERIIYSAQLRELNFGDWEMQTWDEVNQTDLQKWMDNFVEEVVPSGESYKQLYKRTIDFYQTIPPANTTAIISHAGVIRSLLCYFNKTNLQESFNNYKVPIASVYKIKFEETIVVELL